MIWVTLSKNNCGRLNAGWPLSRQFQIPGQFHDISLTVCGTLPMLTWARVPELFLLQSDTSLADCDFAVWRTWNRNAVYCGYRELLVMPFTPAQSRRISQYFSDLKCDNDTTLLTATSSVDLSSLSPRQPLLTSSQSSDGVVVTSEFLVYINTVHKVCQIALYTD